MKKAPLSQIVIAGFKPARMFFDKTKPVAVRKRGRAANFGRLRAASSGKTERCIYPPWSVPRSAIGTRPDWLGNRKARFHRSSRQFTGNPTLSGRNSAFRRRRRSRISPPANANTREPALMKRFQPSGSVTGTKRSQCRADRGSSGFVLASVKYSALRNL